MREKLISLLASGQSLDDGLCHLLDVWQDRENKLLLVSCFKTWPEWSGCAVYPISVDKVLHAGLQFDVVHGIDLDEPPENLEEILDDYRAARISLAQHIIKCLDPNSKKL